MRGRTLPAAALLLCALAVWVSLVRVAETDAGWHVALGRLLLAGRFPRTNALSWVAGSLPWYPTSWLYDALLAGTADALPGALGLQLVTALLFAAALCLLLFACAEEAPAPLAALVALFIALVLLGRVTPRPHVASWAVLAGVLWLCLRGAARDAVTPGSGRRLRLWALLCAGVGGNLHSGAGFAAGVLALFALEAAFRAWRAEQGRAASGPGDSALTQLAHGAGAELLIAMAAPLVLLANPGGAFNLAYLFQHLRVQDTLRLQEFEPPRFAEEPAFFLLLGPTLLLAAARARTRPALLACTVLFAALALRTTRMVYEFEILAAPTLAGALAWLHARPRAIATSSTLRERWGARAAALSGALLAALPGALLAALPLLLGSLLAASPLLLARTRALLLEPRSTAWHEHQLPVRAARFLEENQLRGQAFTGIRDGGYLAYARPGEPIFVDGRIQAVPPALFRAIEEAEKSPAAFQAFLRAEGADYAVTTRLKERIGGFRRLDSPDWALVYWDDTNEVFLRRDVPRFAEAIDRFEYRRFRPYGSIVGQVEQLAPAALPELEAELDRFEQTSPDDPFSALVRCALAARQGRADAGPLCARAAALAPTQAVAALVAKARALRR